MTIQENTDALPEPDYPLDFKSAMERLYRSGGLVPWITMRPSGILSSFTTKPFKIQHLG